MAQRSLRRDQENQLCDMCGRPLRSKRNLQERCGPWSGADMCAAFDAAQRLSGISCVGGHDWWKGAQPCRDAKSLIFLMPSWTSFWLGAIPRRPLIRTDFLTV